jgi:hypothetical protein
MSSIKQHMGLDSHRVHLLPTGIGSKCEPNERLYAIQLNMAHSRFTTSIGLI